MDIITEMQKQMMNAMGHEVSVYIKAGQKTIYNPFVGKCVGFIKALDNVPEVASIHIQMANESCIFELMESEIEKIEIHD